ncbi:carbonic anhydrase [Kordiimonas aestuarii]|uniref:carbonic anhydrase n=1 Tax=Kordiimonas aestuarii TaxID=1005925 RepID=UPI0021CFE8EB|nr:carbonic anhydrase [Kordiimonas aestuarii]
MSIDQRLLNGYRTFREQAFERDRELYEDLATHGQTPHTLVIACSDSRVLVQQILTAGPGDLFVVRNVAAMVPPYETDGVYHGTSAAIEFAVTALEVDNIVVLGHAGCGGVASVVDRNVPEDSFVGRWMRPLQEWQKKYDDLTAADPGTRKRLLERAAIYLSMQNLKSFPFVADRVKAGKLSLQGLLFDIHTGDLSEVVAKHDTAFTLRSVLAKND